MAPGKMNCFRFLRMSKEDEMVKEETHGTWVAPVINPDDSQLDDEDESWRTAIYNRFVKDFFTAEVWRAAIIEGVTTAIYVFTSLSTVITSLQSHFESNLAAIAIMHVLLVTFFIYTSSPVSGGHFNPVLSLATMFTGHFTVPRTILYVGFQCAGSIIGAFGVKAIVDPIVAREYGLGGCILRQNVVINGVTQLSGVSARQGLLSEFAFSFAYVHIAYATGLIPKQRPIYGPILGPLFCGTAVGMAIFASGNIRPGYVGAGFNPARCLGPVAAIGNDVHALKRDYWVYFVGPLCAAFFEGIVYRLIPFDHQDRYMQRSSSFHVAMRALKKAKVGAHGSHHKGSSRGNSISSRGAVNSNRGPAEVPNNNV